jgi:hypothetical protein
VPHQLSGGLFVSLGPEARRFILAVQRYKETRSWADWRQAFKAEPADRDAGTPPDLFWGMSFRG